MQINCHFQTQRHYRNHTNDLTCLCVHPSEPFCASGQAEGHSNTSTVQKPHVQVWNYETLELAHIIGLDLFDVDIGALAFSHKVTVFGYYFVMILNIGIE